MMFVAAVALVTTVALAGRMGQAGVLTQAGTVFHGVNSDNDDNADHHETMTPATSDLSLYGYIYDNDNTLGTSADADIYATDNHATKSISCYLYAPNSDHSSWYSDTMVVGTTYWSSGGYWRGSFEGGLSKYTYGAVIARCSVPEHDGSGSPPNGGYSTINMVVQW
jgi:hypothetical protein